MATEKKVFEIIKEAGFEPIEDKGIVVKYAPENLSAKIATKYIPFISHAPDSQYHLWLTGIFLNLHP